MSAPTSPGDLDARGPSLEVEAVVLGAGISGLVGASVILDQGADSALILDEYPGVGGNHLDVEIAGYTFDVGSFIFQDDSPLLVHFPELLPLYEPIEPSWGRLNPQGKVTSYPFSVRDDVLAAGPIELARILLSAAVGRVDSRNMATAYDFARRWVGARFLHRSGLDTYMTRLYGCPIDQIDVKLARSRMMWIEERARVPALIRQLAALARRTPPAAPNNRQLARPRGGFAALYAPAVDHLKRRGVEFGLDEAVHKINRVDTGFEIVTSRRVISAERVFSTIPLNRIASICDLPLPQLPTVTLISLFYSFDGRRGFDESILYNFSHDARWKRLTVYSDFYGPVDGRTYFTVETVADRSGTTVEEAADQFRQHTRLNALFVGDLRLEGSHTLTNAYPIYTEGSEARAADLVEALRGLGIESFGRQGAFRYQTTARVTTLEAEAAVRSAPLP